MYYKIAHFLDRKWNAKPKNKLSLGSQLFDSQKCNLFCCGREAKSLIMALETRSLRTICRKWMLSQQQIIRNNFFTYISNSKFHLWCCKFNRLFSAVLSDRKSNSKIQNPKSKTSPLWVTSPGIGPCFVLTLSLSWFRPQNLSPKTSNIST